MLSLFVLVQRNSIPLFFTKKTPSQHVYGEIPINMLIVNVMEALSQ